MMKPIMSSKTRWIVAGLSVAIIAGLAVVFVELSGPEQVVTPMSPDPVDIDSPEAEARIQIINPTPPREEAMGPLTVKQTIELARIPGEILPHKSDLNFYARSNPDALDTIRQLLDGDLTSENINALKCMGFIGNDKDVDLLESSIAQANHEMDRYKLRTQQLFITTLGHMAARGNQKARALLSQKLILPCNWQISKAWEKNPDQAEVPAFEVPRMPAYFLASEALKALALSDPPDLADRRKLMLESIAEPQTRAVFASDEALSLDGLKQERERYKAEIAAPIYWSDWFALSSGRFRPGITNFRDVPIK